MVLLENPILNSEHRSLALNTRTGTLEEQCLENSQAVVAKKRAQPNSELSQEVAHHFAMTRTFSQSSGMPLLEDIANLIARSMSF